MLVISKLYLTSFAYVYIVLQLVIFVTTSTYFFIFLQRIAWDFAVSNRNSSVTPVFATKKVVKAHPKFIVGNL
jgi:hypothetical protein